MPPSEGQRLSKVLAAAGVASRRACEQIIAERRVRVNGRIITLPQERVDLARDQIIVDGQPITETQSKLYFVANKPKGFICSQKRLGTKKLVTDLFAGIPARLFTVGRLDRDTTGLLFVTNDGHFAQAVIHPSRGFTKEYLVKVRQEVEHEHLAAISRGTLIEGTLVQPKKVVKMRRGTIKVVVSEGKKREVRLLVQQAGLDILSLHRIRIGPFLLGSLPLGAFRPLTEAEKTELLAGSQ